MSNFLFFCSLNDRVSNPGLDDLMTSPHLSPYLDLVEPTNDIEPASYRCVLASPREHVSLVRANSFFNERACLLGRVLCLRSFDTSLTLTLPFFYHLPLLPSPSLTLSPLTLYLRSPFLLSNPHLLFHLLPFSSSSPFFPSSLLPPTKRFCG